MKTFIKNQWLLSLLAAGLCLILPARLTGQTFTTLHGFSALMHGGIYPQAAMVLSGNTLYGTTSAGGSGNGTVFKVNTDGTGLTTLYSFSATDTNSFNSDGVYPYAGLFLSGNTLYGTASQGGTAGNGTVFKVNTDGSGFTRLYSFSATDINSFNSDGAQPYAGVILSGNTLYGTAYLGGSAGNGTVFSLDTNGADFATLYTFTNGTDGSDPYAGLVLSGNTLYGTAVYGGSAGNGTVFAVNTNGSGFTTLYGFSQTDANFNSDGAYPEAGLVLAGNALYGTAGDGGSAGNGTVFAINTNGSGFATLYSFSATDTNSFNSDGAYPYADLVLSGNALYGTATWGGSAGNGTVFKVNTNGSGFATLYSFSATDTNSFNSDGAYPYSGLVLSGNTLYGTANQGGTSADGTVFAISTNGTGFTALLNFTYSLGNSDGVNPYAGLILSGNTLYGTAYDGGSAGSGTVFKVNTDGNGFTPLYSFSQTDMNGFNSDGANPGGSLILSGNALFGTASAGGSFGHGTVFKVNTDGSGFNTLYTFTNGTDGAYPQAGLLLSGGTLYGTASSGGGLNNGTVFAINTDGSGFTNLYTFTDGTDGAYPYAVLILSGNTLYGTAVEGGNFGYGTVFKVNTDGSGFNTLYSFACANDGAYPYAGLVLSGNTLYGTAWAGGSAGYGTVFKVNTDGSGFTPLYSFSQTGMNGFNSDGANPDNSLILSGNALFGTAALGGAAGNGTVFKVNTDGSEFASLYSFSATNANNVNSDGAFPNAGLILSGATLYGTAYTGGIAGNGTIFSVTIPPPPTITSQPASSTNIFQGQALTLQVGATSSSLTYQWLSNNVPLTDGGNVFGSATSNLVITPVFTNNAGSYSVIVFNAGGSVTSAVSAVTVQIPTLAAQYSAGISDLTKTNINSALSHFTLAVSAAPTDGDANVYLALTRLLALPNQPAGSNFLNHLGFSAAGRDDYKWTSAPPESTNDGVRHLVVQPNLDADEFTAQIRTNILPALIACESNLAQITDPNFGMYLPESVTHFPSVTIDYGDVQMMRAALDAAAVFGYTLHSWNLDAKFGAISNLLASDKSFQAVLSANPNLLKIANPSDQPLAGAAFTNAINRYFAASQFIRNRRAGVRLFNLLTNDLQEEQNFRVFLSGLESSMSAPFGGPGATAGAIPGAAFYDVLNSLTNATVSMANFFNGKFNPRSLFPAITNNDFIWDSFPDTTLGGLLTGLTETNLGKVLLKNLNAQLDLRSAVYTVLCSPTNQLANSLNGVVMGPDGNLYGTAPYGGAVGWGAFFKVTPSGSFSVLHSFGMAGDPNNNNNSLDGAIPSSLVLGSDKNFYGTTGIGGTNGDGYGTIFKITPGGALTTVYTFGNQNDGGSTGGNPLILGADGNLYGVTQSGGDNSSGVLFQFIPPAAGKSTEGTFNSLSSLPYSGAGALVQGRDGYFYGAAQYGGDYYAGGIFQFIPANGGQFNTLCSFPPSYDFNGFQITLGLSAPIQAANGVLYGAAQFGGNIQGGSGGEGDGFLYCVDTNGNFTNLYDFDENHRDGYGPIGALAQGSNGAFYGITAFGGGNGDGTIFKFTQSGALDFRVWFGKSLGEQQSGEFIISGTPEVAVGLTAASGAFYGTAPGGGTDGYGTVFRFVDYDAASILVPPVGSTNALGSSAGLTVTAGGAPTVTYKWYRVGGGPLPGNASGTSSPILSFTALTATDAGSYYVVASNAYGTSTSALAALTVLLPPTIKSAQPATPLYVSQGAAVSLFVVPSGTAPFTYQWLSNNLPLANGGKVSGAATSNLVINPASINNSANYSVIVSNSVGSITSKVWSVTIGIGPAIFPPPPSSITNLVSNSVTLSMSASGTAPLRYQWRKNGTAAANNIPGATNSSLTFTNLVLTNSGSYAVVVTNAYGSITSSVTVLTVLQGPTIAATPKAPSGILQGEKLSLTVKATGSGLIYQWLDNGLILADNGFNISGAATSNLVINPAYTSNSGPYKVVASNSIGSATSAVFTVTVSADTVKPAVTIASPAKDGTRSNPVQWTFSGRATDNVMVTNVNYWITNLNGSPTVGPLQAALSPASGSAVTWTASVSPAAGSNIFFAQSWDFSGNTSPIVSRTFFAKSPVPLPLAIAGTGSGTFKGTNFITGETNVPGTNAPLYVGESYSITAIPDAHSLFVDWTGTAGTKTNRTLNFIMESNTSITANIVTNMFLAMTGTYNGLFSSEALGVTEETSGMIGGLTLKTNGIFTATLYLDGSAPSLSGTFSPEGSWSNSVSNALDKNVKLELIVGPDTAPRTITGWVIGTNNILVNGTNQAGWASFVSLVAATNSSSLDAPHYTLLIPPFSASPAERDFTVLPATPPGYGYALLSNMPGTSRTPPSITLSGAMADGTAISQNVSIGEDNTIPVYPSPYNTGTNGILFGWLSLSSNSPSAPGPSGALTWIKKTNSVSFKAGFTNLNIVVQGSPWISSLPLASVIPAASPLIISGNGLTNALTLDVTAANKTNLAPTSRTPYFTSAYVNTNNGQFTLSFTNNAKVVVTGRGVLLQDFQRGAGFFASPASNPTNFGSIKLGVWP